MRPKRAALYARTSEDKDDDYIITSQIVAMKQYAEQHGFEIAHVFREEFTGTKLDRPELSRLRKLIRDRKIDVVIIYRADRLARKQHIAGFILEEEIFPSGVELHVVTFGGRIRPGTRDVLIFNIEAAIGQDERDVIVERTQRGKRTKLLGGDGHPPAWIGYGEHAKYGYEKRGKRRNTHHVIVEEEAKVVRHIYDLFANKRKGVWEIARLLDAEGVPPPSISKGFKRYRTHQWSDATIYKILREHAYAGVWYANKRQQVNGRTLTRPKEEWIRLDFPELRIIDEKTFSKAQEILANGRRNRAHPPTNQYLMARRMRCECPYTISVRAESRPNRTPLTYYYCASRTNYKATACPMPFMRGNILDTKVWACITELLENPRAQLEGLRRVQQQQMEQNADAIAHMKAAENTIKECERLLSVYSDQEAEGLISRAMLRKKKIELDERVARAQAVYDEYAALVDAKVLSNDEIGQLTHWLAELREQIEDGEPLEFETRRAVVEALNITGKMKLETTEDGTEQVLYLYIHTEYLARIVLQGFGRGNHDVPPPHPAWEDSIKCQTGRELMAAQAPALPAWP